MIVWLTNRSIYKSFICHHCVVLYTVYVARRSQHVAPRCTLRNNRPRLLPRLPFPIPTPLKLALLAQAPACSRLRPRCCCCCCCCRPAAVGTPHERRQNGWLHAETAGDYKRRCRIMTNRIYFAYRSARSIFSWADGCSTCCDLFNLVPRCQVSRFQRPTAWSVVSGVTRYMWSLNAWRHNPANKLNHHYLKLIPYTTYIKQILQATINNRKWKKNHAYAWNLKLHGPSPHAITQYHYHIYRQRLPYENCTTQFRSRIISKLFWPTNCTVHCTLDISQYS